MYSVNIQAEDSLSIWVASNNEFQTVTLQREWTPIASPIDHDFLDHAQSFSGVSFVKEQNGVKATLRVADGHLLCVNNISFNVFESCPTMNL